jgi:uncharacterized protein (DUF58 family)
MLDAEEARQLDRLALGWLMTPPAPTTAGTRVASVRGFGLEFHDFRRYQPGDDPRSIDWTIHARLRQLVVKVFQSEAHLRVHLLVDTSASMGSGTPDKLTSAKKLAALLCYIAAGQHDAVGVATFDDTIRGYVAPATGRSQLARVFEMLSAVAPRGRSAANRALLDYGAVARGPGLAVVISDFFEEGGTFEGLRYLLHRGLTPAVVQVVAPEELDPMFDDEVELVDIEDDDATPILVDPQSVASYRERMSQLSAGLAEFCTAHGLPWARVDSSFAFSGLLDACVNAGLVSGRSGSR